MPACRRSPPSSGEAMPYWMFAVYLKRDPPVHSPSHLVDRQPLAFERMKHREIPRENVNAQPLSGRRGIVQEVAERVGIIIVRAFGCECRAAVDIPTKDEHHASCAARDHFARHAKIIGAFDQQTKTISMPNAVAIAARFKNASVLMRLPRSNGFLNRFAMRKNR
jgi:hypothetical protein